MDESSDYERGAARERERIASMLLGARIVCPVHGIPDCGPLLNGCSIPRHIAEWRADVYSALVSAR